MAFIGNTLVGEGNEKVVVMHDWLSDHTGYDPMLPYLDTKKFCYAFVDLRGYGKSKTINGSYTVEEAASDIINVVNFLEWTSFHLIGHSMSAMIGLRVAIDIKKRIKSLIAITPVSAAGIPMPDQVFNDVAHAIMTEEGRRKTLQFLWGERLSEEWLEFKLKKWKETADPQAVLHYLTMYSKTNFLEKTKGLDLPILAIAGEYDQESFQEKALKKNFLEIYPNATIQVCGNAGHYPMQETPVYLATLITRFLKK